MVLSSQIERQFAVRWNLFKVFYLLLIEHKHCKSSNLVVNVQQHRCKLETQYKTVIAATLQQRNFVSFTFFIDVSKFSE